MYIQATPLKGLTMRARVGYNYTSFLGRAFKEAFDYRAFANPINSLTYSDGNYENITGNFVTTYEKAFRKHSFKIMGGYEASKVENVSYNVTATDLPLDIAWSFNLATGTFKYHQQTNPLRKVVSFRSLAGSIIISTIATFWRRM